MSIQDNAYYEERIAQAIQTVRECLLLLQTAVKHKITKPGPYMSSGISLY